MQAKRQYVIVSLILLAITLTNAQTPAKQETFASFWQTFKAAISRNDKQAVANVTKLPFLYDSQERDRAGFLKIYDELFTRKIRRCLATAKPTREGQNYDVFCGELIFYFGKDTDGRYKLLEFGVND